MDIDVLGLIDSKLQSLNINYEFGEWSKQPVYPYFVGEYSETESSTEDGLQESTFKLTGFTRNSYLGLEQAKEAIKEAIGQWESVILANGNAVVISYSDSMPIPTGDAELKKLQINLKIKEWKVN